MSKLDTIKEQIGWLKVLFGTLVAADLSILAWLAQNIDTAVWYRSLIAVVSVFVISYTAYRINRDAFRKMKQLEKL